MSATVRRGDLPAVGPAGPASLEQVRERLPELLGGRRLVIVSNREPYVHHRTADGIAVERPAGGLVAALDPVMQAAGGLWVAWGSGDADFDVVDGRGELRVPPEEPRYTLRRLRLDRDEVERYYHGYANQALWPLFHLAVDKARFRRRDWTAYAAVNDRFADAVAQDVEEGAVVWLQDYHLALAPGALRRRRPDLFLMQFWHVPWPSWDVFRICPQSADLIEGLLANDLLAFHLPRFVENFLDCAQREVGADADPDARVVEHRGHRTRLEAFPISIDVAMWARLASSPECQQAMARLRRRHGLDGRRVVLSVDRLDYTKGIPERLAAIDLLFRRYPGLRGQVMFVQKAAPSRTRIAAYRRLQHEVEASIERINRSYGTASWQPVVYLPRGLDPASMAALYRMADVCLVTPLQDGMNLVAKEFVACQVDRRGVLVLSELAGAADEIAWSVPVNPFDREQMAEAIVAALEMPAQERADRINQMQAHLHRHDIYHWVDRHLRAASQLLAARAAPEPLFERLGEVRARFANRDRVAILADFDGTLAPIVDRPEEAAMPPHVRARLGRLARLPQVLVGVVSGRALPDLRSRVGLRDVILIGNHGFEIEGPGWGAERRRSEELRALIASVCRTLEDRLADVPGVIVENKGVTASVHYRLVPRDAIESVRQVVLETVRRAPPGRLTVRRGKMVLEIRPAAEWDKGQAVRALLEMMVGRDWVDRCAVVYIGDDRTDEDAFAALGPDAITVRVGDTGMATAARFSVGGPEDVARLLAVLAEWLEPPHDRVGSGEKTARA